MKPKNEFYHQAEEEPSATVLIEFVKIVKGWNSRSKRGRELGAVLSQLAIENPSKLEDGFTVRKILTTHNKMYGRWRCGDPEREPKLVRDAWKHLAEMQQEKREGVIQKLCSMGLQYYPEFVYREGGGGSPAIYTVVLTPFSDIKDVDTGIYDVAGEPPYSDVNQIEYIKEDSFGGLSPFLIQKAWRTTILFNLGLVTALLCFGVFSIYLIFNNQDVGQALFLLLEISILIWVLWLQYGYLFKVQIVKIIPLPAISQSIENNRLVEFTRDDEGDKKYNVVTYSGACPICEGKVWAMSGGKEFYGRVVGKCENSPVEHVYSFDHVTRSGKSLR